jgi:hypothetical protein
MKKSMSQNKTIHLTREFLSRVGGGEPAENRKLFRETLQWETAPASNEIPGHAY